jgi:ubiquinone/menaquinone biosynthesis C-methylase UbiE
MTAIERDLSSADRIVQVLHHLGINRAHIAARVPGDWQGLVSTYPETVASLTLVGPLGMDPAVLRQLAPRLLVIAGAQGRPADMVQQVIAGLPDATLVTLHGYPSPTAYTDVAAERAADIGAAMLAFMARRDADAALAPVSIADTTGEVAGVSYRVQGSGLPLVLLPLSVAPSQWEPLLPQLSARYCTIVLGGAALGMIASLETRGHTAGYLRVVGNLIDATELRPGERVLEVGCGTGVLDRWLARRTGRANRIMGVDINAYLLREAAMLVQREGLADTIEFRQGNAENLPFADEHFGVVMSSTVIQWADADRMLAEMVRVTKPGGRVAVIGHAHDLPRWVNLPLPTELKHQIEAPGWGGDDHHPLGCHEASLYQHIRQTGLTQVQMFPQFAAFNDPFRLQQLQASLLPTLSPEEADAWRAAVAQAEADGTFFIATPFHCVVGTKP